MEKPLVTIITPSYNQGEFIENTIRSVIAQTYSNLEYILVDGGSTDNTLDIIQKYRQHITRWVSEADEGQSDAINKGFRMASGKIWMWLNSDDMLLPDATDTAVKLFDRFPDAGLVFGDADIIDRDGNYLEGFRVFKRQRTARDLGHRIPISIPQPAAFLQAEMVRKAGFVNINLNYAMDYDLFWRVARYGRVIYIPTRLAKMRFHTGMKTVANLMQNWREKFSLVRKYDKRWYLSRVWIRFILFYLLNASPRWLQTSVRRARAFPRDLIFLEQTNHSK